MFWNLQWSGERNCWDSWRGQVGMDEAAKMDQFKIIEVCSSRSLLNPQKVGSELLVYCLSFTGFFFFSVFAVMVFKLFFYVFFFSGFLLIFAGIECCWYVLVCFIFFIFYCFFCSIVLSNYFHDLWTDFVCKSQMVWTWFNE